MNSRPKWRLAKCLQSGEPPQQLLAARLKIDLAATQYYNQANGAKKKYIFWYIQQGHNPRDLLVRTAGMAQASHLSRLYPR